MATGSKQSFKLTDEPVSVSSLQIENEKFAFALVQAVGCEAPPPLPPNSPSEQVVASHVTTVVAAVLGASCARSSPSSSSTAFKQVALEGLLQLAREVGVASAAILSTRMSVNVDDLEHEALVWNLFREILFALGSTYQSSLQTVTSSTLRDQTVQATMSSRADKTGMDSLNSSSILSASALAAAGGPSPSPRTV